MSYQDLKTYASSAVENLNKGLPVSGNQIQALGSLFCDGKYYGHVEFSLKTGRIAPEEFIKNLKASDLDKTGFLLFLSFLIRNGLDVNYYFKGPYSTDIHIAAYIYSINQNTTQRNYIFSLLESAGSSFYLQAYTGNRSISKETVENLINYEIQGLNDYGELGKFFYQDNTVKTKIEWSVMKNILLDKSITDEKTKDLTDFLEKLEVGENFSMRAIILYLIIYSGSESTLKATLDECLFKNNLGNMELGVYMAINSQNPRIFKIVLDKGSECNYLCMSELICRHHQAKQVNDEILVKNFSDMIEYAVLTGAEIDNYQLQFLMVSGSSKLLENIRNNYAEPKWKKFCNISRTGDKAQFATKKLRQIAFNLNLDFSLSPTEICEKLEQINNEDRLDFVKKSIERQEERVLKNLVEAGKVREGESLDRIRCNFRSSVINNPYAYNDARIAFYRNEKTGEVWCFTADFFESMVTTGKNPYNKEILPDVFKETIKTQLNILKLLDLYHTKDNKNIEESLKETFTSGGEINNDYGDSLYVTASNLFRLYTMESEIDFREKSLTKINVLKNFVISSFIFSVGCEFYIHNDFLKTKRKIDILTGGLSESDIYSKFKIYEMLKNSAIIKTMENKPGFTEFLLRIVSYNLINLEKYFTKGVEYKNSDEDNKTYYYTDKTREFKEVIYFIYS